MFKLLSLAVFAIVLPNVANAAYCDYINLKDCSFTPGPEACGTNGKTYRNACFLAKAYCVDKATHKAHDGQCAAPKTTPAPIDGGQIALDIFCLDISYIQCGPTGPQVCGTDGNFYSNLCEFDKARCTHRYIHANGTNCS